MPWPNQESGRSCIYVFSVSIFPLPTIFIIGFEIAPTVCFFSIFLAIRGEDWAHQTSLALSLLIDVSVPSQVMNMCVRASILTTIFLLDVETFLTVWCFLFPFYCGIVQSIIQNIIWIVEQCLILLDGRTASNLLNSEALHTYYINVRKRAKHHIKGQNNDK